MSNPEIINISHSEIIDNRNCDLSSYICDEMVKRGHPLKYIAGCNITLLEDFAEKKYIIKVNLNRTAILFKQFNWNYVIKWEKQKHILFRKFK
jgi:hypothetical protein